MIAGDYDYILGLIVNNEKILTEIIRKQRIKEGKETSVQRHFKEKKQQNKNQISVKCVTDFPQLSHNKMHNRCELAPPNTNAQLQSTQLGAVSVSATLSVSHGFLSIAMPIACACRICFRDTRAPATNALERAWVSRRYRPIFPTRHV